MRISIALATYNGEKYIERQLDSLLRQTRPADEVIIRDDCSTDATYSVCERYIREHSLPWTLCKAEKNGGYRENFRACVEMTTGDWVLLCDQDDDWMPEKLDRFEKIVCAHPEASGVASSFVCIDQNDAPIVLPPTPGKANHGLIPFELPEGAHPMHIAKEHPELLLIQNIAMGCCMGFSRAVCDRYLRLTQCDFPHDWELALVASYTGEIIFTTEPLIRYRLHGKNTIGLPGLFDSDDKKHAKRPSEEGRMRVMDDFDGLLASAQKILTDMGKPAVLKRYIGYSTLRRKALTNKSLLQWVLLHRYFDIYQRMFTFKQRLGDLYVILRK